MKKEKISVVIATYNQEKTIAKVLKGYNQQTFRNFAVYFCDDGSSDNTFKIAKKTKVNFPIKFYQQKHKGMRLAKNINQGLKEVKGEYAVFTMGDSIPKPDYLEQFSRWLERDMVLCGARENITIDGELINYDWRYKMRLHHLNLDYLRIYHHPWTRITGNGLLVPLWALKKVGLWPEDYVGWGCDDNILALRLYVLGLRFAEVPKARLQHVEHKILPESQENIEKFKKEARKELKKLRNKVKPQTVCLNFDDFSPVNTQLFFLRKLKKNYPNLKVSLFTIPETVQTGKIESFLDHPDLCEELRRMDWLEFLPHGWNHPDMAQGFQGEFKNMTYYETSRYIKMVDKFFKKINLPYKKIFKAPQYQISEAAKDCFRDNGWVLAIDGEGSWWPQDVKKVWWNWNIVNPFPARKVVVSYAHLADIGNGLLECYQNILQIPPESNFVFLSEIVEKDYKI